MKKVLFFFISILSALSAVASPQAVVFDFGGVMASLDRKNIVSFFCETLQITEAEFEVLNREKKRVVREEMEALHFWNNVAKKKGLSLSDHWFEDLQAAVRKATRVHHKMYALVHALKKNKSLSPCSRMWNSSPQGI